MDSDPEFPTISIAEWERRWFDSLRSGDAGQLQTTAIEHALIAWGDRPSAPEEHLGRHVFDALDEPGTQGGGVLAALLVMLDGVWPDLSPDLVTRILDRVEAILATTADAAAAAWWESQVRYRFPPREALQRLLVGVQRSRGEVVPTLAFGVLLAAKAVDPARFDRLKEEPEFVTNSKDPRLLQGYLGGAFRDW